MRLRYIILPGSEKNKCDCNATYLSDVSEQRVSAERYLLHAQLELVDITKTFSRDISSCSFHKGSVDRNGGAVPGGRGRRNGICLCGTQRWLG